MESIGRLIAFYQAIEGDPRIRIGHIGLYVALFQQWALGGCREPFSISRSRLMKLAKIQGKATYHKYLRELTDFGYIEYLPSYDPIRKSLVSFR